MILAVDTSLGSAVALVDDAGRIVVDVASPNPLGHAEVIGDLLRQAVDASTAPITHVVAGMGPGPFTGLRIGIATARAFALGRGITVLPAPSHYAAALTAIETDHIVGPFAIVTDARRREVAVTVFDGLDGDSIPNMTSETILLPRADADAHLAGIRRIDVETLSAGHLAQIGARAAASTRTLTGPEPLYLRQPDVTMPGAPKRVGT